MLSLLLWVGCDKLHKTPPVEMPKERNKAQWITAKCSECKGIGTVSYDKNHPFVINGLAIEGEVHECSICMGEGELLELEIDKSKKIQRSKQ